MIRRFGWTFTAVVLMLTAASVSEAQDRLRVVEAAPLFLLPDARRVPLHQATPGMSLTLIRAEGAWYSVSWDDPRVGRRYGYVEARFVRRVAPLPPVTDGRSAPVAVAEPSTPAAADRTEPSPAVGGAGPGEAPVRTPPPVPAVVDLGAVRRVFVEKMDHDLDQYLRVEIASQLKGRLLVVLDRANADAILRGVSENRTGVGAVLGLRDNASASITLVDQDQTVVLWAGAAGDRSLFWGAVARGGQRSVAERLVSELKKALEP